MKEMLKSKSIILFIVLVLGISFIEGATTKLEQNSDIQKDEYLSYNMR